MCSTCFSYILLKSFFWTFSTLFMAKSIAVLFYFLNLYLLNFRERGREGERLVEKHRCESVTWIGCFAYVPQPGNRPATQACVLTGNSSSDLLLRRTMPNQLRHTNQHQFQFCFSQECLLHRIYFRQRVEWNVGTAMLLFPPSLHYGSTTVALVYFQVFNQDTHRTVSVKCKQFPILTLFPCSFSVSESSYLKGRNEKCSFYSWHTHTNVEWETMCIITSCLNRRFGIS